MQIKAAVLYETRTPFEKGKLDLDRLITETYSLDQINEAYTDMLSGEVARGVIVF